jgi:cyclic-di-GMP-binding protein
MPSFDVVSKVDMQEVDNAVNQAIKQVQTRYDFKGSKSRYEFDKKSITIHADDRMKLDALKEILHEKMAKRGVGLRALDYKEEEQAMGGSIRQVVEIKQGISQDDAREIVKKIKAAGLKKIQAQIQGDQVRVTGPKRDDLQGVIQLLKKEVNLELQFVNFKD